MLTLAARSARAWKAAAIAGAVAGMTLTAAPRASAATPSPLTGIIPYEVETNAGSGYLWGAGNPDPGLLEFLNEAQPMAPGTSPSVVALPGLGYESVFQGSNGDIWFSGTAGVTDGRFAMAPGTSPSAAATPSGAFPWAAQGANHDLWKASPSGPVDVGAAMAADTSPAVAEIPPNGTLYPNGDFAIAFQGSDGTLWDATQTYGTGSTHLRMSPGTSPATAYDPSGGSFQMVVNGANGDLWTTSAHGPVDLGVAMAPGTSPSLTEFNDGGYEVAFHGANGDLWTYGKLTTGDTGLPMLAGTNPSIAATISVTTGILPTDNYSIAYSSTFNNGWIFLDNEDTGPGNTIDTTDNVASGTSPSLAILGE